MTPQTLARVVRGETVESIHSGHLVIWDGASRIFTLGDPDFFTFFRSSAKPFQAIPVITSGAADRFGFTGEELALACASHSGEAMHVNGVAKMLDKIGLGVNDLRCGAHLPFYEKEAERMMRADEYPTQLHNNCSGKHTAMLAACLAKGYDISNYEDPLHPLQQDIIDVTAKFTGIDRHEIKLGIDGCAAPNFAVPLSAMATSFYNMISPPDAFDHPLRDAAASLVNAMKDHPQLVGGSERLDTMLMKAAKGAIISKVGADGVWLCGVLPSEKYPRGLSIALKVEDGDDKRGRPVAAVTILRELGILTKDELSEVSPMQLTNRRGDVVGKVISDIKI